MVQYKGWDIPNTQDILNEKEKWVFENDDVCVFKFWSPNGKCILTDLKFADIKEDDIKDRITSFVDGKRIIFENAKGEPVQWDDLTESERDEIRKEFPGGPEEMVKRQFVDKEEING